MLEKFSNWFSANADYIAWWTIGWMSFAFLDSIGREQYVMALIDLALIYWNYKMWRERDV